MENGGNQRLRFKIGAAEFEAEGPPDAVQRQLDQFMELFSANKTLLDAAVAPKATISPAEPVTNSPPTPSPVGSNDGADSALKRIFRVDGDKVSLLATPKGDRPLADALLILLYGFNHLAHEPHVTGVSLMQAAKQSGLPIPRIDREMMDNDAFVLAAGAKRGKRYSLNNRGTQEAERIIREMLQ